LLKRRKRALAESGSDIEYAEDLMSLPPDMEQ